MKRLIVTGIVLFAGVSGEAMADCSAAQVTGRTLTALIAGKTVCAVRGGERWQEQHRLDGTLWDYKKGPGHPVDPSEQVGIWGVNFAANNVTYTYTGGSGYTYTVHGPAGGPYSFCTAPNGTEVVGGVVFKTGITSCP